jgi:hypothetical protein
MSKHSALSSFAPAAAAVVIAVHRPHARPRARGWRGGGARRASHRLARATVRFQRTPLSRRPAEM